MMILPLLLACASLTESETAPEPAPVESPAEEAPTAEPVGSPATAAAQWVTDKYPGIPAEGYTLVCDGAACSVTVPEHDGHHSLTCTPGGCSEVDSKPEAPAEAEEGAE